MERKTITKVWFLLLPTKSVSHSPLTPQPHLQPVRWLSGGRVLRRTFAPRPMGPHRSRTRRRCSARATPAPMLRHTPQLGRAQRGPPPGSCWVGCRRALAIAVGLAAVPSATHVVTSMASELYASRTWQKGGKSYFRDCFYLLFLWI